MLKPIPETLAAEMVTPVVPTFVKVIVCDALLPTRTLPISRLDGLTLSAPCTPVALKDTVKGDLEASLVIDSVPATVSAECGAN